MANSKGKTILALVIVIIIIVGLPIIIFGSVYYFNEDFQLEANKVLRDAPGGVGSYFEKMPTASEKETKIMEIADWMLDVDKTRAIDKLEKFRVEDAKLYESILKYMLRENPNRTKDILDVIRRHELNDDLIISTIEEINNEVNEELKDDAIKLAGYTLPIAKTEMERVIESSINGHLKLVEMLLNLEDDQIAKLIDILEEEDFKFVLSNFSKDKQSKILNMISEIRTNENDLNDIVEIYKTKKPSELAEILLPDVQYTIDELVYIFEGLKPELSGHVLSEMENEEFTLLLVRKIKEQQLLEHDEDKLTKDILKSLKIFTEFDDNLDELTGIYQTMEIQKVATTLEDMMRNSTSPKIYYLENGETIEITDEDIAIEIINNFNDSKIGEIISYMTDSMASQVSRKLSIPRNY